MSLSIAMTAIGGPEVLKSVEAELLPPAAGEVRLRHSGIGVNFVDIYHRQGLYPVPGLPAILGVEGAGIVEAVGSDVTTVRVGDRVAYAGLPIGAYAEVRNIPAQKLVHIPPSLDAHKVAAAMLRGITAHMLLNRVYAVEEGTTILVHAAAGGLGLILTQWAKRLGATVIGTVGSPAKAELALSLGLDHAILYREVDFVAEVHRLTNGRGVDVAYDGIGAENLLRTFDAVRFFGTVVSVGQAGGPIPIFPITELKRSLSLVRPSVLAYASDPVTYGIAAHAVFDQLAGGLVIEIGQQFPLREAPLAQRQLEKGETQGSVLLVP